MNEGMLAAHSTPHAINVLCKQGKENANLQKSKESYRHIAFFCHPLLNPPTTLTKVKFKYLPVLQITGVY